MSQLSPPSIKQGNDVITVNIHDTVSESSKSTTLRDAVRETVKEYFLKLDGVTPSNVYELFIAEIESPLLEIVLQYCRDNQSFAAKLLNISRGTLRKKMALYGFLKAKKRLR